jgi:hypothetical protein
MSAYLVGWRPIGGIGILADQNMSQGEISWFGGKVRLSKGRWLTVSGSNEQFGGKVRLFSGVGCL